jgi:hypothetical protein
MASGTSDSTFDMANTHKLVVSPAAADIVVTLAWGASSTSDIPVSSGDVAEFDEMDMKWIHSVTIDRTGATAVTVWWTPKGG